MKNSQKASRKLIKKYANTKRFTKAIRSIQSCCEENGYTTNQTVVEVIHFINRVNRLTA